MSKETFSDHPWSDHLLTEKHRRLYVIIERSDRIHLFGGCGQTGRQARVVWFNEGVKIHPETDLECFPLIFVLWRRELFAPTPV